jgi:hypothetical protein
MNQSHFFKKIDDGSISAVSKTGINIDPMAAFAKFPGKFPDVDAHAAGVIRSQISDGVGMDAEHCDS